MASRAHRVTALATGAAFLLLGVAGLVATAGLAFLDQPGALLLGLLSVNPAQSALHAVIGAGLLGAVLVPPARAPGASRAAGIAAGLACLALGFLGLGVVGTEFNALALNGVGNVLHFASASALLAIGLGVRERPAPG